MARRHMTENSTFLSATWIPRIVLAHLCIVFVRLCIVPRSQSQRGPCGRLIAALLTVTDSADNSADNSGSGGASASASVNYAIAPLYEGQAFHVDGTHTHGPLASW